MKPLLRFLSATLCAALLALAAAPARAAVDLVGDDTDLFTRNPNIASQIPNVLLIVDNTSNWSNASQHWPAMVDPVCTAVGITGSQQGDSEVCAIYKAIGNVDEQVNIGLMMFNDQDKGAYVRVPMKPMNSANVTAMRNVLVGINTNDPEDKAGSNSLHDKVMNDAFRYFNSLSTFGGTGAAAPVADVAAYTSTAKTAFQFLANVNDTSCGYDYIIFIGNGISNKSEGLATLDAAAALLNDPSVVPNKTILNNLGRTSDVWARFLFQYGVKIADGVYRHITTYTIDVCKDQCDADNATILKSMATVSQGKYHKATNLGEIEAALKLVFAEVQAVNSVFAATTLPVSINVRGTNLNQVYIGVFRPDPTLSPRWIGNLKHYKLGVADAATGQLELQDAASTAAVNLNTGFISNTATSIWTERMSPDSLPGFWAFRGPPFPSTDFGQDEDGPDGDLVEKGGAAQMIRKLYDFPDSTPAKSRKIYTCTGVCASGDLLSDFPFHDDGAFGASSGITPAALKTFGGTQLASLTGVGSTATGTSTLPHGFSVGQTVVISGATPAMYNGEFTVLTASSNTFTYSLAPNSADANNAFATFPGYTLVPGLDFVVVTNASPVNYNTPAVTANPFNGVAVSAVAGEPNQFSYPLSVASPTSAASGYTVTGVRRISNLSWANDTARATATLPNHGYASGDIVKITGATPAEFNFTSGVLITKVDNNQFTYPIVTVAGGSPITADVVTATPHGFSAGDLIVVTGASPAAYNTVATGSTITNVTANSFRYTTSSPVSGPATIPGTAVRRVAADLDTYTVTTVANGTGGNRDKLILTISGGLAGGTPLVPGQQVHTLAAGDPIAVQGITCIATVTVPVSCSTVTSPPSPSGSVPPGVPYTITIESVSGSTIIIDTNRNDPLQSFTSPKVYWTGETFSAPPVVIATAVPGPVTVTATGAPYASKDFDLTTKVTSIASQGVATGNINAASSGSADPLEYSNLIAWVRGKDNKDNENLNGQSTDIRATVHGDVLHSRPSVVNYNRFGDENDVYIFYGSNDGMLRAIKGGNLSDGGREQWGFIPSEFFGKLKRLRDQTPVISSNNPRDFFFDGPIGTYTLDSNTLGAPDNKIDPAGGSGDKVHLYVGMRRGGRMLYALDVSEPLAPKLLWKKGCAEPVGNGGPGNGGCDFGFGEIGQTWSEPKLGYLRAFPNQLVVMFAAGWDAAVEDFQPCVVENWNSAGVQARVNVAFPNVMNEANCPPTGALTTSTSRTRTMGRGIFILDAADGNILWRAGPDLFANRTVPGMNFSMPADLAILRNRANTASRPTNPGFENVPVGFLDRIYATDTGGNVWRVDLADPSPANWVITKFASVAEAPVTGQHAARNYRKFLFMPDVVYTNEADGTPYDAVLVGSGDREHPFDTIVRNRFYMFKDKKTTSYTIAEVPLANQPTTPTGAIIDSASSTHLADVTSNCLQTCTGTALSAAQAELAAARGWKLSFGNAGEKVVSPATTAAGTVIFNTNEPKDDNVSGTTSICVSSLGTARQYGINFQNATANNIFSNLPAQYVPAGGRFALFAGGGFLPTPVPVVVKIGDKYYQTIVAGVQTTNPGGLKLQSRLRTYWYRQIE